MKTIIELRELESPLGNQAWMTFQQHGRVCFGDVKLFSDGDAEKDSFWPIGINVAVGLRSGLFLCSRLHGLKFSEAEKLTSLLDETERN